MLDTLSQQISEQIELSICSALFEWQTKKIVSAKEIFVDKEFINKVYTLINQLKEDKEAAKHLLELNNLITDLNEADSFSLGLL